MGGEGKVKFAQFYTPSIAIFSLIAACYTSLVLGVATARDQGLFKRVRGTPLPMGIYLGSWMTGAATVGIAAIVILFAVAVPAFGVQIYANTLPAAVVTLLLGAACLCALGLAVATLVKTADQAMPVAQLTFLPISFISGIWFPLDGAPDWLLKIAQFFPRLPPGELVRRVLRAGRGEQRLEARRPARAGHLGRGRPVRRPPALQLRAGRRGRAPRRRAARPPRRLGRGLEVTQRGGRLQRGARRARHTQGEHERPAAGDDPPARVARDGHAGARHAATAPTMAIPSEAPIWRLVDAMAAATPAWARGMPDTAVLVIGALTRRSRRRTTA